jgi:crotonobetainyl-CoA:carnitine CoA-transferase CaiB-like acyl-CoA transferase
VLDLSIWRPGPYATQLLAGMGADVIKVEPPGGDPMRTYRELFEELHAGKRSVVLDLKQPRDRSRALELAAGAHVVVEGWRPGVAARLGVGEDDVRAMSPAVVYCSVSGYGQTGALVERPGHDVNYQAMAGTLAPDGGEPVVAALPVADLAGGMAAALAICAALVRQVRTGTGERIDLAMADVLATWTGSARPTADGVDPAVRGVPGYGVFATADGHVALGIISEQHFWTALCDALDLDAPGDLTFTARCAQVDDLQADIAAALRRRRRDDIVESLGAAGVPISPVLSRAEIVTLPHFAARDVFPHRERAPLLDEHPDATWFG